MQEGENKLPVPIVFQNFFDFALANFFFIGYTFMSLKFNIPREGMRRI